MIKFPHPPQFVRLLQYYVAARHSLKPDSLQLLKMYCAILGRILKQLLKFLKFFTILHENFIMPLSNFVGGRG